jgi:Ca2+-binding RTX toxin-like protein
MNRRRRVRIEPLENRTALTVVAGVSCDPLCHLAVSDVGGPDTEEIRFSVISDGGRFLVEIKSRHLPGGAYTTVPIDGAHTAPGGTLHTDEVDGIGVNQGGWNGSDELYMDSVKPSNGYTLSTTYRQVSIGGSNGDNYILGTAFADAISSNGGLDTVFGGFGADLIEGGIGADELHGGGGDDLIRGNDSIDFQSPFENDLLWGDSENDLLYGQNGADILRGGGGSDWLEGGFGNDTYVFEYGGVSTLVVDTVKDVAGIDLFDFSSVFTGIHLNLNDINQDQELYTNNKLKIVEIAPSIENVYGSSSHDEIVGNSIANAIYGRNGNDTLYGGGGNDTLYGESGTDTGYGGSGLADVRGDGVLLETWYTDGPDAPP